MVEQPVEDVGGVADGGADDFGMERGVLVRDVGVELSAGFLTVFEVDLSGEQAAAAGFEVLAVRG